MRFRLPIELGPARREAKDTDKDAPGPVATWREPDQSPVDQVELAYSLDRDLPYGLRLATAWTWRILLIGVAVVAGARVVGYFSEVTIPFFVAILLAALLQSFHARLASVIPRGLATAATMIGLIAVIVGTMTLTGTQLVNGMADLSNEVVRGLDRIQVWLREGPFKVTSNQLQSYLDQAQDAIANNRDQLVTGALSATSTATAVITGLVLALFILIFLLHDGRGIWRWVVHLLPATARYGTDRAARKGWVTLTHYVRATIVVAMVDAIGIGAGAAILGVPLAVPIAVLTFFSAFVPMLGAIFSGSVACLVALVALGPVQALIMLAIVLGVQQLESHVLQPLLLGRAVSLHPLGVVLSLACGFIVAGVVGGVFAVPLMAFLNTVRHSLQEGLGPDPNEPEDPDAPLAMDVPAPTPIETPATGATPVRVKDIDDDAVPQGE